MSKSAKLASTFTATNPNWSWRPDGSMPGDAQLYEWLYNPSLGTLLSRKVLKGTGGKMEYTIEVTFE